MEPDEQTVVTKELDTDMSEIYAKDTGDVIDEYVSEEKVAQNAESDASFRDASQNDFNESAATEYSESKDDKLQKRGLINKIRNYYSSSFRDQLVDLVVPQEQLATMSVSELNEHLETIQYAVSMRCNKVFNEMIFYSGFSLIESAACRMGWEVQGFATIMQQEHEVKLLIEELGLKYQDYIYVKPEYRLLGICLITMNRLHIQRRATAEIANSLTKPISEATAREYVDL